MIRLEPVDGKNIWDILALRVAKEQEGFVASNTVSILEAYIAGIGNGHAFPFGIYDGDTPVGFVMIGFDTDDYWEDPPAIAKGNYSIWRLMIDAKHQGRGYGKAALRLALDVIRSFPCGEAKSCWLSYAPENTAARNLYHGFGFSETGEEYGGETIAVLTLQEQSIR